MSVLRPKLYNQLIRVFGEVKVANQGSSVKWSLKPEIWRDGVVRPTRWINKRDNDTWGEIYRVNCPYCNDRRHRLYLGHLWGHVDDITGDRCLWMAFCQNENCISDAQMRKSLHDYVWACGSIARTSDVILPGKEPATLTTGEVEYPGSIWPLDRLSPDHPAVAYIRGRRYNPAWLAVNMGVGYIWEPPHRKACLRDRIFIPVYLGGTLVGWQARSVGSPRMDEPKYLFSARFPRSISLYNYDIASKFPAVTVLEGATKVWRFGADSVAAFGKRITDHQLSMLVATWRDIVFMLDDNARKESLELVGRVTGTSFRVVLLQDGQQPDEMDTVSVRALADRARLFPVGAAIESAKLEAV